ncbi:hypothetical protein [Microbispora sp. KK1-11]|uniref:hypothetical protein n=1 Tax=Microbispora sp. KK1-11 TaxID=2053005 RepID=UPI00163C0466|nr:hypothetical protein [Microbispora sp. KK1-11]
MTEASMTRTRMTEARETTRTSPPAPQTAVRSAALSGILVIAQIHRVSEDM